MLATPQAYRLRRVFQLPTSLNGLAQTESGVILSMTPNHWASWMNIGLEPGPAGWQDAESAAASVPDKRLQRRLRRLLEQLSAAPGKPVPAACGDWAATKAAYGLFDNPRVTEHGVMAGHFAATAACFKASEGPVLIPSGHDRVHLQSRVARQDRVHEDHQRWAL